MKTFFIRTFIIFNAAQNLTQNLHIANINKK